MSDEQKALSVLGWFIILIVFLLGFTAGSLVANLVKIIG